MRLISILLILAGVVLGDSWISPEDYTVRFFLFFLFFIFNKFWEIF